MAEHSFLVQHIAIDVSRVIDYSNHRGGPINIEKEHQIVMWAMWHDMLEVKTGDIATPTKLKMKSINPIIVDEIEHDLSEEYDRIKKNTFSAVLVIVKLADYMEALGFLREEGNGDHAKSVAEGVKEQMLEHFAHCKHQFPSYQWSNLDEVLKSC